MIIRNLFVLSLLFSPAAFAASSFTYYTGTDANEVLREEQLAAEEAKKSAQTAAIEASQQKTLAVIAKVKAAIAEKAADKASALAVSASEAAATAALEADVTAISEAVTSAESANDAVIASTEYAQAEAVKATAAAEAAAVAAAEAQAAADIAVEIGLKNWVNVTVNAAERAAESAVKAAEAATEAAQSAALADDSLITASAALKTAEKLFAAATYTGTDVADFDWSLWEVEGPDPIDGNTMLFDALKAQHTTSSGSGWRHELKIISSERVAMTESYEDFSANVRLDLSTGSKTIISQFHASDTGTIMKLYVADSSETGFYNSIANDGIFDVFVRLLNVDGTGEQKKALGTIESGDNFDFQVINDHGYVTVSALGETFSLQIEDSPASYLKFGNYLQAQDAVTGDKVESSDDFAQFYADAGIIESEATFTNINYERIIDPVVFPEDEAGQSVAITDEATDSAGKIRINLDSALPTGKVSVNVRYSEREVETAYLTLFGASTSSSNAIADLKMDTGYAAEAGNVGIKLRSTDDWIADYPASQWSNISISWDNVVTSTFTVSINGTEIGTYDMNFIDDVESIELKLGSNSNVSSHVLYVDDINVYSDIDGTEAVYAQDFENILVGTDLSGYDANLSSSTNSAFVSDLANAAGYTGVEEVIADSPRQSLAITDTSIDVAGLLRLRLDDALSTGKVSVKVKYDLLESETVYLTLFGSSTSTSNAVADLKMDSGYSAVDGNVGIKLRSTDAWIADYAAGEWATITVAWDNVTTNQITVAINDVEIGSYAMYNNFDVEKIDLKLGSNGNVTDYTLYIDDLIVYSDIAGTEVVFADDFEAFEVETSLTGGYGDNYDSKTNQAVITDAENATVAEVVNTASQSLAITDTSIESSGQLRLKLDEALPVGKVSVNVKYDLLETETAYLTLYGSSTSTSNAVADLKMDSGYSAVDGNVGIKLRSTDAWIADYAAGEWTTISVAWDNVTTNQITVSINGVEIGSYAMYNNFDVEKIDLKLSSTANTTDYTFYVDDFIVYSDIAGTEIVFADDFESTEVGTDISGTSAEEYAASYDSKTTSAVINNVENSTVSDGSDVEEEVVLNRAVAITDTSTDNSGKLRLQLDTAMSSGKLSVDVKYALEENETAYITLFGSSTSTSNAVADLKMDSSYAVGDDQIGIKLRSTDAWIADFAGSEWATISVVWDNEVTNQITVSVNDVEIGSYAMYNNFDVETIDFKLSSTANTTDYIFFIDNIVVYADTAGTSIEFSDDFETTPLETNLSGYGTNYSSSSASAVVSEQVDALIVVEDTDEEEIIYPDLNTALVPSDNFNLAQWNLSIPTDADNSGTSDTIKETILNAGYENNEYFYSALDGGMVFRCYISGYKTSTNTTYTRTELREMLRAGDTSIETQGVSLNNWVFSSAPAYQQELAGGVDGNMKATLAVNYVTTTGDTDQIGRVIVGQIHAAVDEPIRIYYRLLPGHTKGSIYFAHEPSNGNDEQWYEMVGSRSDSADEPADGIELNEQFSYEIDVQGNFMTVSLYRDGKDTITEIVDMTDSGYDGYYVDSDGVTQEDYMYFKAGVYNQNKTGDAKDYVQATFYSLEQTHY
ncbi:polysaccharide lyase family 7 protein [Psychromonas sp.]|nr:polysaccharide lyase family 7 protein [Psychromonas sp.]